MPDASTEIWNRACLAESDDGLETGDRALRLAIAFTGFFENGGLAHALEVSGLHDTIGAANGLRWFGLGDEATLVEDAMAEIGRDVLGLDRAGRQEAFHRRLDLEPDPLEEFELRSADVLSGTNLLKAFESRLRSCPKAFSAPTGV